MRRGESAKENSGAVGRTAAGQAEELMTITWVRRAVVQDEAGWGGGTDRSGPSQRFYTSLKCPGRSPTGFKQGKRVTKFVPNFRACTLRFSGRLAQAFLHGRNTVSPLPLSPSPFLYLFNK